MENLAIQDEFAFPGTLRVPSSLSFDITYTKSGNPRNVKATGNPISGFDWSGEMWSATSLGSFSVSHIDGSFSANGTFSSLGQFGEMGTEKNGVFVNHDDGNKNAAEESSVESIQTIESAKFPESANPPLIMRSRRGRSPR